MTDSPNVLRLEPRVSTTEFTERLAERGLGTEFTEVQMPGVPDGSDHSQFVPHGQHAPVTPDLFQRLRSLIGRGVSACAYIGGTPDVSPLVNSVATEREAALVRIDGAFADTSDLFGSPTIVEDHVKWIPGSLPRALQMTRDGPVVLHVESAGSLDESVRDALLTLLTATESVTLTVGDETVAVNLSNLSVVFTDAATPEVFAGELGSQAVFRRVFDASFDVTEATMFDPEAERHILTETEELHSDVADGFVEVATQTREMQDSPVSLPFDALVNWAHLSRAYAGAGIEEPVYRAAENAVILVYSDTTENRRLLDDLIKMHVPPTLDGWE